MKTVLSLYSLKGIACLMVVMGHIPSIMRSPLSPILNGVPLFLMISGYFLYAPDGKELARKALHQLKKIICIIICVHTVYAIYSIVRTCFSSSYVFPIHTWGDFFNWVFHGTTLGDGVLWYLHSYAWSLLFLWLFSRKGNLKYMQWLPFLLVAYLILGRYQFLFPFEITAIGTRRNCFTVGLPYIAIGFLVHKYESVLRSIDSRKVISVLFCSLIMVYCEIILLTLLGCNNHFGDFIFSIPLSVTLFALMAVHPTWKLSPWLVCLGRDHSANIYYWHMLVAGLCSLSGLYIKSVQVLIVFGFSLLLSMAIRALRSAS